MSNESTRNRLLREIKEIAYDLIDSNGNFRTMPIGLVGSRNISSDRVRLLQHFITLLKTTNIINQETKIYIFNKYINIKGVNETLNEEAKASGGKEVNYNTTISKIGYDRIKLERMFGSEFLMDILYRSNNADALARHTQAVIDAYIKYSDSSDTRLRHSIALNLDRSCICVELDDERFRGFIEVIMPYIRSHMEKVAEEIDKDCIGYFNYLLTSPIKNDIDNKRLDYIRQLLSSGESQINI